MNSYKINTSCTIAFSENQIECNKYFQLLYYFNIKFGAKEKNFANQTYYFKSFYDEIFYRARPENLIFTLFI